MLLMGHFKRINQLALLFLISQEKKLYYWIKESINLLYYSQSFKKEFIKLNFREFIRLDFGLLKVREIHWRVLPCVTDMNQDIGESSEWILWDRTRKIEFSLNGTSIKYFLDSSIPSFYDLFDLDQINFTFE